jgi:hypothetical protein
LDRRRDGAFGRNAGSRGRSKLHGIAAATCATLVRRVRPESGARATLRKGEDGRCSGRRPPRMARRGRGPKVAATWVGRGLHESWRCSNRIGAPGHRRSRGTWRIDSENELVPAEHAAGGRSMFEIDTSVCRTCVGPTQVAHVKRQASCLLKMSISSSLNRLTPTSIKSMNQIGRIKQPVAKDPPPRNPTTIEKCTLDARGQFRNSRSRRVDLWRKQGTRVKS